MTETIAPLEYVNARDVAPYCIGAPLTRSERCVTVLMGGVTRLLAPGWMLAGELRAIVLGPKRPSVRVKFWTRHFSGCRTFTCLEWRDEGLS